MFGKHQVIKFEQNLCNAKVDDNSVLFVRVRGEVNKKDAEIEVPFSHIAFIIKSDGVPRFYESGTYPVFETKDEIKRWKNGSSVDVVYIPKETNVQIRWGTRDKIRYRDPISGRVIEVGASGEFRVEITQPNQFMRKIVGVKKEFDLETFQDTFCSLVVDEFASTFPEVINQEQLSYDMFDANRRPIATKIGALLSKKFSEEFGIGLANFIIQRFVISDEDIQKVESITEENRRERKIKEHLAELERLSDKQWEKDKYLLELEKSDKSAYYEVLKAVGDKGVKKASNFCPKCGHSIEANAAFCPNCGNDLGKSKNKCSCGKENPSDATFCVACGKKLK